MRKFAKVINDDTKECHVGLGSASKYYAANGMTEQEVEQASNGSWYLAGKAPAADPEELRADALTRLEDDLHAYVFTTHDYPQPTQITLQAVYSDPDSTDAQRAACKAVFDWIRTVLAYYYERKKAVTDAADPSAVPWNFSTYDATAPGVTLAKILGGV